MKGIKCCGECAYYSMKNHKCMGGAKDPGKASNSFYADCPLVDAQPLRCGRWIDAHMIGGGDFYHCSECGCYIEQIYFANDYNVRYCPNCGAKMDAADDQGGGAENAVT